MLNGSVPIPITLLNSDLPDMAVRVFAVVSSYSKNPAGCFATAEYIADVLTISRESAQRMLSALTKRGFIIEQERRRLLVGRRARPLGPREAMVMVPRLAIREILVARKFRLYSFLLYCSNVGRYVTDLDLMRVMRKDDGSPIGSGVDAKRPRPDTARRLREQLAADGWVSVADRTGRGSLYRVSTSPRLPAELTTPVINPVDNGGVVTQPGHTSVRNQVTSDGRNQVTPDTATLDLVTSDDVTGCPAVGDLQQRRESAPQTSPPGSGHRESHVESSQVARLASDAIPNRIHLLSGMGCCVRF